MCVQIEDKIRASQHVCPNRGLKSTAFELFVRLLTPGHKFNPMRLRFLYHLFCIEVVLCVDPHIFQG